MKQITQLTTTATACLMLALPSPAQDADQQEPKPDNAQQAPATATDDQAPVPAPAPSISPREQFDALSPEQRQQFNNMLMQAQALFSQKRVLDTLQVVDELDKIFVGHPAALNIRAACYVEIRAFEKAYPIFEKILELTPESTNVQFNLAELDFVTRKWESAHKRFSDLISTLPANNKAMIRLCEFKLLLCKLKMGRVEEAAAMSEKYDSWDDTPYYYYARAALVFHQGDKQAAEKILLDARFVWGTAALSSWQDTLIEFGYVRSFYGGEYAEEDLEDAELIKPGDAPLIRLDNP